MWHEWACSLVWAWLCPLSLLRGAGGENWEKPKLPPPLRASWVPDVTTFAVPGSHISSALSEHRCSVRASARNQGIEMRTVALLLCRAHCDSPLADRQQNDWRRFGWARCVGMMFELLTEWPGGAIHTKIWEWKQHMCKYVSLVVPVLESVSVNGNLGYVLYKNLNKNGSQTYSWNLNL